jgi:two-component system, cell cycle sensor histidine kinase and response regulator CckA
MDLNTSFYCNLQPLIERNKKMPYSHGPSNKFEQLRKQAEELIQKQPELSSATPSDILELIHELRIHQIELEIQNEELKQAQHGLSDLHQEYENLYEFAPCGYLTLNTKGIITRANLTGVVFLGQTRQRLLHSGFSQFIASGWEDIYQAARRKSGETGKTQIIELPLKGEKDSPIWVRANIEADRDETGAVVQWRIILVDITAKKVAETALIDSEEKYRSIMEAMKDGVYICSPEFRIEYLNPAMIRRLNYDATGELCYQAIYGSDEKCSRCSFDKIQQGEHIDTEFNDLKNNRYYIYSHSPIRHEDSSVSILTIVRDITHIKKMERHFHQIQKMEAIGVLAGGIAHQFNNSLFTITGNIDLFEMDFPTNENVASSYTKKMKASVERMTLLTDQLLAFARGGKYLAKKVSLCDFVKETVSLIKLVLDPLIKVHVNPPGDILYVTVDTVQLHMVLSAILINASESLEGKSGNVHVTCRKVVLTGEHIKDLPGLISGNFACISIADDGKGMDENTRNRIFEPFFTNKIAGRGLGMAATYGIVKNHNGWISVDSELDKGTIVKIYLPVDEIPVREYVKSEQKPKPKTELIIGKGTILVIDDEEAVRNVTRTILERLGYRVLEAKTGEEAIDVAKTFDGNIDLAMQDIILPGIRGVNLYRLLMKARPNLKVIVFSGYSKQGPARKILDAGADYFIKKPFTMADLSEKLKKALEGGQ